MSLHATGPATGENWGTRFPLLMPKNLKLGLNWTEMGRCCCCLFLEKATQCTEKMVNFYITHLFLLVFIVCT